MQYTDKAAESMLDDKRYTGIISRQNAKVWKTRGAIPNKYFNPDYVKLISEGKEELATEIKDPYFNPEAAVKSALENASEKESSRLREVLSLDEINRTELIRLTDVRSLNDWMQGKVKLSKSDYVKAKSQLSKFLIEGKKLIADLQKRSRYTEKDVESLDRFLSNKLIVLGKLIPSSEIRYKRIGARLSGRQTYFEPDEIGKNIDSLAYLLLKAQI